MRILLVVLAIALSGCGLMGPGGLFPKNDIPVSQTLSPAAQTVQNALNEANVTLTAAANVVAQNVAEGIYTKPQGQSYVAKIKDFAKQVDAAQVLLQNGDILNADKQAQVLSKLIIALHKEVATRSRQ